MRCLVFPTLLLTLPFVAADEPRDKEKPKHTNKLSKESSPYLLQHAHNPVDWYPWGEEAFAKAKKDDKLVFLSIGYSSCHWCHVMEKESFANDEVAKILNEHFVCIKVDREERPDIDQIYMTALNVFGQRGGWPLSMFLTADGKPIAGGTYWPREDREIEGEKVRGFKSLLKVAHDLYKENPKKMQEQADKVAAATSEALARATRGIALVDLDRSLVAGAVDSLKEEYDPLHGGFGSAANKFRGTKFPTPPYLELLIHEAGRQKSSELKGMLTKTLDHMAQGGIYDHLGGGFHRYSTERTWTVPHFEKMLYDNAQLGEVYARAFHLTEQPLYIHVVQETLEFVSRELTSPEGAFYSALDADSEAEEGRFYVWTDKDLNAALTEPEMALARAVYETEQKYNFEGKYHILVRNKPFAEAAKELKINEQELAKQLAPVRLKLFNVRGKRERPFLDKKVLAAWNGQMIAGFATAGHILEEPKYIQTATRAADFVLQKMRTKDGRLLRSYAARPGQAPEAKLNAYLDDYAFLVHGLLCLHDATRDKRWLDEARALTDVMVKFHGDLERGGLFYTSSDHEKLFARGKDQYDGAQPSANSVATRNLVRLWTKTKDDQYRSLAEKQFKAFSARLKAEPSNMTTLAQALAMFLDAQEKKK
jgi:uncharacterized protein YyaL (SSP411 family)